MTPCSRCQGETVVDFARKEVVCASCSRVPAWCRCQPVKAEHVPLWIERARANRLPAKEMVA